MTFEEARDVLKELDLRVRSREEESDQAPGTVLFSEPGVGTEVPFRTQVTLVIAKAPAPPPDNEETPPPGGDEGEGAALGLVRRGG